MQNSILEQAKVTEQGADYMERVIQVKRQPVWRDSLFDGTALKNDKFHLQENFWSDGTESACIHHPQQAQ